MCGILAISSPARPIDRDRVLRGLQAIASRGPDGEGVFLDETARIALGHRRLALVDLEGGAQPLSNGSVHAVVNGELYDAAHLRADLTRRGHRFRSQVDSELLVHLYEEYGLAALERMRGEFAFVLWDARRARLFAARDRFGVKPLCFAQHDGALYVASQAKALFAVGVPAQWDVAALEQVAAMQYPLPGTTLFRHVRQLEPGHLLLSERGEIVVRRYWDLDYPRAPAAEPPATAAEFAAAFEDAVTARLVADLPAAFQLSGGIDSSSVAAVAARALGTPVDCFTVGFDDPRYDETAAAREIAEHLGARHHLVQVSDADVAAVLPAATVAAEGLSINAHLSAKYLLAKSVREAGFKIVLTGEGADEVLAGYAHLRADLGRGGLLLSNAASRGIMLPDGAALPLDAVQRGLGYVPTWLHAKATLGFRMRSVLHDVDPAVRGDAYARFVAKVDREQLIGRGPVEQSLYLWCKTALEGYILRTLGDGMEMAHSIEGRLPFLDSRLFEVVRRLPIGAKISERGEKGVLREAMHGLLPRRVLEREKHPFLAPPSFTKGGALSGLLHDALALGELPVFDVGRVKAALERMPQASSEEQVAWDPVFYLVLGACILQRSFGLGA